MKAAAIRDRQLGTSGENRHRMSLIGMDQRIVFGRDAQMLRRQVTAPSKDEQIAGLRRARIDLRHVTPRRLDQRIVGARFSPIGRINGQRLRLAPVKRAPDTPDEAETIAPNAKTRALMSIGCADPAHRLGKRVVPPHGTNAPPSNTPSSFT